MMTHAKNARRAAARGVAAAPKRVRELAEEAGESLDHYGEVASDAAHRYYDRGRRAMRHSAGSLHVMVEEQPVRSTLIAVGLGCLLCAWFVRR